MKNTLENYLQSILDYYKLKYKLDLFLTFEVSIDDTYCQYITNKKCRINIDHSSFNNVDYTIQFYKRLSITYGGIFQNYIISLLHEINHAIENKIGLIAYEYKLGAKGLPHDTRPYEKRADYFALQEAKKWL